MNKQTSQKQKEDKKNKEQQQDLIKQQQVNIYNKKVTPNIIPVEINNNLNTTTVINDEQKDKENYNVSNFELPDDDYDDEEENKN